MVFHTFHQLIMFPFPLTTKWQQWQRWQGWQQWHEFGLQPLCGDRIVDRVFAQRRCCDATMPHLISPRGGAIPPRSKILQGKCAELTLWVMSYGLWVWSMTFWKHRDLRLPLDACWDITSTWVKTFFARPKSSWWGNLPKMDMWSVGQVTFLVQFFVGSPVS